MLAFNNLFVTNLHNFIIHFGQAVHITFFFKKKYYFNYLKNRYFIGLIIQTTYLTFALRMLLLIDKFSLFTKSLIEI